MFRLLPRDLISTIAGVLCLLAASQTSHAQGLLWNLPEDGSWVRYEGSYRHVKFRPQSNQGDLVLGFRRNLEIRSVGKENADYKGASVPCRWIEIEVVTGKEVDGSIKPGPGGQRIYKVLVPESEIHGMTIDENGIPIEFVPIVKGFRKIGTNDVEPIETLALQVSPVLTLIRHSGTPQKAAAPESVTTIAKAVQGTKLTDKLVQESKTSRSTNTTNLWISDEVPFGPAKWTVNVLRESKGSTDLRNAFQQSAEITVSMQLAEIGTSAQSKLATP